MNWEKPTLADFWKAVEIYLAAAYDGPASAAVRARLDMLANAPADALYQSPAIEPTPKEQPVKLGVRLGNRCYPHMKLVVERSPDGRGALFRADTHDQHVQVDPASREYSAFCKLTQDNQSLAGVIEANWEAAGLPTFKSFLRKDLARRQAARA